MDFLKIIRAIGMINQVKEKSIKNLCFKRANETNGCYFLRHCGDYEKNKTKQKLRTLSLVDILSVNLEERTTTNKTTINTCQYSFPLRNPDSVPFDDLIRGLIIINVFMSVYVVKIKLNSTLVFFLLAFLFNMLYI